MSRNWCECVACGTRFENLEAAKASGRVIEVTAINRGGRVAYICDECAEKEYGYDARNNLMVGEWKAGHWTASWELEVMGASYTAQAELLSHGYLPTSDCTVWREYKSPIYRGLGGLVKYSKSVQQLLDRNDLRIDHHCGAHLHLGVGEWEDHLTGGVYALDGRTLERLWAYRDELLGPLGEWLDGHPTECEAVFGRALSPDWADTIERATYCHNYDGTVEAMERCHAARYGYCNLASSSDCTIEWRVLYFNSAEQYGRAVMLCKTLTALLLRFNDYARSPYYSDDEIQRKALRTGYKMLEAFLKELRNRH